MVFDFLTAIAIIIVLAVVSYFFRQRAAQWLSSLPGPHFLIYVLSSVPFILIEENVNCLPTGCELIPSTLPLLLVFVIALGLIVRHFKIVDFRVALVLFMLWGYFVEVFVFRFDPAYFASPLMELLFGVFWLFISYATLVIVPLAYLQEGLKK